jgi:integration host factor subunit alpha
MSGHVGIKCLTLRKISPQGEGTMNLNKADIAQRIAEDCGFMKHEAREILEKLLEIIRKRLIAGGEVMVTGFGKWRVRKKRARRGRNPRTGEPIVLAARKIIVWNYSPVLKRSVNGASSSSP